MNTFPDNEIEEVNEMLHKLLGNNLVDLKIYGSRIMFQGERFMGIKQGDVIKWFTEEEIPAIKCFTIVISFLNMQITNELIYCTGISIFPLPSIKTPLTPLCERGERAEHLYLKQKTGNDFPPFAKGGQGGFRGARLS